MRETAAPGALQQRYDMSYIQCMAVKGEKVPHSLPTYAYGAPACAYPYNPAYYPYYYAPYYGPGFVSFGFGFGPHRHWHR